MNQQITMSVIEIFVSLVLESVILGSVFTWISNKSGEKMEQKLKSELSTVENQNKMIYQETAKLIQQSRDDILSEIKEVMK